MKRTHAFGLGGMAVLFFFLLGLNLYQDYKRENPESLVEEVAEDPLPAGKKRHMPIKELTFKPVKISAAKNLPLRECRELFTKVASISVKELYQIAEHNPRELRDRQCFNAISSLNSYPFWSSFYDNCLADGKDIWAKECRSNLINFRIMAIGLLFEGSDNLDEMDDSALMCKLLWSFMKGGSPTEADIDYNLLYADELIRRLPDLYAAHKAKLVNLMLKELIYKREGLEGDIEAALSELKSFDAGENFDDFSLIRRALNSGERAEEFKDYVDQYIVDNPEKYAGHYFKANLYWKEKNRKLTLASLEKAHSVDPSNKMVRDTLAKAKTAKFEEKIFSVSFDFNFSNI